MSSSSTPNPCTSFDYADSHTNWRLLFVNDDGIDRTLMALRALELQRPKLIAILDLPANAGKAGAIRLGMVGYLARIGSTILGRDHAGFC